MIHLTRISRNAKTGPIPVSTSPQSTCPDTCGLFKACYAKSGPLAMHWAKVGQSRGVPFNEFLAQIRALPRGQLWRHNQAGDLKGDNQAIDAEALKQLTAANKGRRGFTYTHKPMTAANAAAIGYANQNGFTVNLSADNAAMADHLSQFGPVVVVLPTTAAKVSYTPEGRKIVVCPAQTRDKVTCSTCGLCQAADRAYIIGFRAHGTRKNYV